NLHFTNFQARQEVTRRFRYRIRPVASIDAAAVRRFGRDLLEPLQARHMPAVPASMPDPPIAVTPPESLLVELRPVDEGVRVRIRNISDESVSAEIRWRDSNEPQRIEVAALGVADGVIPG
ncbi:MAG: hypothetical protein Q8Q19_18790, partial [Microbacterium sp.]|nr:hypothetical protein [Microbacterium sp.]